MSTDKKQQLSIAWCDNGLTDGNFTENLVNTILTLKDTLPITGFSRVQGIQIARQRQAIVNNWLKSDVDWMLWVDSDIAITPEILLNLWQIAHEHNLPLVSGLYFTLWSTDASNYPKPVPSMFQHTAIGGRPIHDFPKNSLLKVDYIGLGIVLIHRSVIESLKKEFLDGLFFVEEHFTDGRFIGEDASFCKKLTKIGIPIVVHTGSIVDHIKRIPINNSYYDTFMSNNQIT